MKLAQVKAAQQAGTPVQYRSYGDNWLADGWHDATIAMIDSDSLTVHLNVGNAGQVLCKGREAIRERLRGKE
jgi:hypothetical protein